MPQAGQILHEHVIYAIKYTKIAVSDRSL